MTATGGGDRMVVESDADVTVTITADLTHLCPFVNEIDHGSITITYRIAGNTLELHALRDWFNGFKDSHITHEGLTDLIRHHLATLPGIEVIDVRTNWTTAGMDVTCSTSPTPAGQL